MYVILCDMLHTMARMKKQFNVIIEQDQDGFFVASVPALPGCHTQARTKEELKERIQEAISLCLDVARTDTQYYLKQRA